MASSRTPTPPSELFTYAQLPKEIKLACADCAAILVSGSMFHPVYCHRCRAMARNHDHLTGWIYVHDYELELLNLARAHGLEFRCLDALHQEVDRLSMVRLTSEMDRAVRIEDIPRIDDTPRSDQGSDEYADELPFSSGDEL